MSLLVKGIWERGTFTVPESISEERLDFEKDKFKQTFGKILEGRGYTVLEMTNPILSTSKMKTEPGLKRYDFHARIIKEPVTMRLHIPDYAVAHYQKMGLKLID